MVSGVQTPSQWPEMGRSPETWDYKYLRTKHFHEVSSGNQPPYLLKSRYGEVRKLQHSLVTEVKEITISPLYITEATFERNILIRTAYGETLDLVLYADQRNKLALTVPLEEEDLTFTP